MVLQTPGIHCDTAQYNSVRSLLPSPSGRCLTAGQLTCLRVRVRAFVQWLVLILLLLLLDTVGAPLIISVFLWRNRQAVLT